MFEPVPIIPLRRGCHDGIRLIAALLVSGGITSCSLWQGLDPARMLKASESCYTPLRERITPWGAPAGPSPPVPLLSQMPSGSRVLGTFSISADFQLILQALQYNAHRVGADAVVVHKLQWWDIRNWADPRTVTKTETIQPTEQEKKEYREKLKEYEAAKQQGKSVKKPTEPTQTRREEEVFVPGHWQVQGNASLEASFIERVPSSM